MSDIPEHHDRSRGLAAVVSVLTVALLAATLLSPAPRSHASPDRIDGGARVDLSDGFQPGALDVYWLDHAGALRNPDGETPEDATLYNVAGEPLELTWGEYAGARGQSLAIAQPKAGKTLLMVKLRGLVPDGVYSLFATTFGPDSQTPGCTNALRDLPVTLTTGARPRPDASSFTAKTNGRAWLVGVVDTDLLAADLSSLQVVYHSNGQTYHPMPNRGASQTQGENCRSSYGVDAVRHLFIHQEWDF